jgi:hypothetical protein
MIMKNLSKLLLIGLTMLLAAGCEKDNPVEPHDSHNEAEGLVLKINGAIVLTVKEGKVEGGEITVKAGLRTDAISVWFLDLDGDEFIPDEEGSSLSLEIGDGATAVAQLVSGQEWQFIVQGKKAGVTQLKIKLLHGDHSDFTAPAITVRVEA